MVATPVIPDYVEPILGWRTWLIARTGGEFRLRSLFYPTVWVPSAEMVAECFRRRPRYLTRPWRTKPSHGAVESKCQCGIHAARQVSEAAAYFGERSAGRAIGLVRLWGEVVEHERGWRASHAYPEHIFLPTSGPGGRDDVQQLEEELGRYGVPVERFECRSQTELVSGLDEWLAAR